MRLIHTADLHLASEMESRLTPEKARMRRKELSDTFKRIADYAEKEAVAAVLISGDIFDEERVPKSYVKEFVGIVRRHPSVDFLCLAGNHDESLAQTPDLPENLRCFGEEYTKYSYGRVDIYGIEQTESNAPLVYSSLDPDRARINIVMLHGQTVNYDAKPAYGQIVLPRLRGKSIDYLALGHIHSYDYGPLDERGVWCYSGCPEGRGYDECGTKGIVVIDVDENGLTHRFLPFAQRTIREINVDLTGCAGGFDVEDRVQSAVSGISADDYVRVVLKGETDLSVRFRTRDLEESLSSRFFSVCVKNSSRMAIDLSTLENEQSLRGEFVRRVREEVTLSEEEREQILRCGILALEGEEVQFS